MASGFHQSRIRVAEMAALEQNTCLLPPAVGSCDSSLARFHFSDGRCKPFVYSGCGGNENNFERLVDCAA